MSTSSRRGLGSLAAAMVAALLAAGSLASPALAASSPPPPTYRADASLAVLPAGAPTTTTIQLTQLVAGGLLGLRELGSVRITPPAGFVLTAVASQLRPHFHAGTARAFARRPRAEHALLLTASSIPRNSPPSGARGA